MTPRIQYLFLAASAFVGMAASANAQFSYSASTIASDVTFGNQNGNSYASDFDDFSSSSVVASNSIGRSDSMTINSPYGYTYSALGATSMASTLGFGGVSASFAANTAEQLLSGGNSFVSPASKAGSSADIVFTIGTSDSYSFSATGTITDTTNNADFSFIGTLTDTTHNQQIEDFTVAAASNVLSPVSTTVSLVAGDTYELSYYALSYDIGNSYSSAAFNGSVQIGNPQAVPEPASMTLLAVGAVAAIRRRRK